MNTTLKLGLIIFLLVVLFSILFSDKINPNFGPLYGLKRLQEKFYLDLKRTPESKAEYEKVLLENRAQEIKALVESQNCDYLLHASLRYSTTAGDLTNLIKNNNLKSQIDSVRDKFMTHQSLFQALWNAYPKDTGNLEYKYLQDDINYLKIYSEQLLSSK